MLFQTVYQHRKTLHSIYYKDIGTAIPEQTNDPTSQVSCFWQQLVQHLTLQKSANRLLRLTQTGSIVSPGHRVGVRGRRGEHFQHKNTRIFITFNVFWTLSLLFCSSLPILNMSKCCLNRPLTEMKLGCLQRCVNMQEA